MNRVLPSQIVELIETEYPNLADQTNVGSQRDHNVLAGVVAAVDGLSPQLVPAELSTRLAVVLGTIRSALRAWERGGRGGHYISGHEIQQLLALLRQCPDEPFSENPHELPFIDDERFRRTLALDLAATRRALTNGEWKSATVLGGSVIEALCLWAIQSIADAPRAREVADQLRRDGRLDRPASQDLLRWQAAELIAVAESLRLISADTARVANSARDYRNLIHPGREIRTGQRCTQGTAHIVVGAMHRVIEDLEQHPR